MSYESSPAKEEWALLNKFKAMEFQKIKEQEFLLNREKKLQFKHHLDAQLHNKNDVHQLEVEEDRRYYEFITKQAQKSSEKELQERHSKMIQRKNIEEHNQQSIQYLKNSRKEEQEPGSALAIGIKSEIEKKQKSQIMQREMMDTLDLQLREKTLQSMRQRERSREQDELNNKYQFDKFDRRGDGKAYQQNFKVYDIYEKLDYQRSRSLARQDAIAEEAAMRKAQEEAHRKAQEESKRAQLNEQMKSMLEYQVKSQHHRKQLEGQFNPEEVSYGVISNIFRPKEEAYDKNKYYQQLRQQAEEKRRRKQAENFMSQQEYRINMNQLNKVVTGAYSHENYLDRSLSSIGDDKYRQGVLSGKLNDPDSQVVKNRLEYLKSYGRIAAKGSQHEFK